MADETISQKQNSNSETSPPTKGGEKTTFFTGVGEFVSEHKTLALVTGGAIVLAFVISYIVQQQNAATSSTGTSSSTSPTDTTGTSDSGVAYALTQLGQQLNNLNTAFSNVASGGTTTTTPPATTPPANSNPPPPTITTAPPPASFSIASILQTILKPGRYVWKGASGTGRWWYGSPSNQMSLNTLFPAGTTLTQNGENGPLYYTLPGGTPQLLLASALSGPPPKTGSTSPSSSIKQTSTSSGPVYTFAQTQITNNQPTHSPVRSYLALTPQTPRTVDLYHNSFVRSNMMKGSAQHYGVIRPMGKFIYASRVSNFQPIVMPTTGSRTLTPPASVELGASY